MAEDPDEQELSCDAMLNESLRQNHERKFSMFGDIDLRTQAIEALKKSASLFKLACDNYEQGNQELAYELRKAAERRETEAQRLFKHSSSS